MKTKPAITTLLLLATILLCFALPKPKYESLNIVNTLKIPTSLRDWRSDDLSQKLNLQQDDRYNFISNVFARRYYTPYEESLLFLMLDAGNFHHPKICFKSSGFSTQELADTEFSVGKETFRAKTLLAQKGSGGFVIIYWIVINKKQTAWAEQKFQQLWHQLTNKKKVGVMGRLDIPIKDGNTSFAITLAQKFIRDMSRNISDDDSEYMFGK